MCRAWLNGDVARDALRPRASGRSRVVRGARGDNSETQNLSHGNFQLNYQETIPGVVKAWAEEESMRRGKEMPFLFLPDFSKADTRSFGGHKGSSSVGWRKGPPEGSDQASGFSTQSQGQLTGLPQDQGWLSKHGHGILVLEEQPIGWVSSSRLFSVATKTQLNLVHVKRKIIGFHK